MFVDASAIVAVLNQEPGWPELVKRLDEAEGRCIVSPLVRFEATLSLARAAAAAATKGARPKPELIATAAELVDELIDTIGARDVPITNEIGKAAVDAAMSYGKIVGHPAALNFGDCFAYACAKSNEVGLIFKGNDFAHTDLA